MLLAHDPLAHPEQSANTPAPPGEEARVPPTLQGVMLAVAPARSALADFCVLWQTGALLSTSREMRDGRGEFLSTRTTLKGRRGARGISAAEWAADDYGSRRDGRIGVDADNLAP